MAIGTLVDLWSPVRSRAGNASVPGAMFDQDCEMVVFMLEALVRR